VRILLATLRRELLGLYSGALRTFEEIERSVFAAECRLVHIW